MELSLESPDIIYYDTYVFTGQIKVCVCGWPHPAHWLQCREP